MQRLVNAESREIVRQVLDHYTRHGQTLSANDVLVGLEHHLLGTEPEGEVQAKNPAPDKDCRNCKFAGMDMDMEPYCVNADVLYGRSKITGRSYPYGLDINPAFAICKLEFWTDRVPVE